MMEMKRTVTHELPSMPEAGLDPDGQDAMLAFYGEVENDLLADLYETNPVAYGLAVRELVIEMLHDRVSLRKGVRK